MRFAAGRQKLLAHNIANLTTPNYQTQDVSTDGFQRTLSEAVDRRRAQNGGNFGDLRMTGNREIEQDRATGRLTLRPQAGSGNILSHDRNDRDLERSMQALVENATYFRAATDFMRQQKNQLMTAITERV